MNPQPHRIVRQGDITDVAADAVIFSSNTNLFLSGGAGASLLGVHGDPLQRALHHALAVTGKKVAHRGLESLSEEFVDPAASPVKGGLFSKVWRTGRDLGHARSVG